MSKRAEYGTGSEIIYHFDVEQHRIPLQQFIDTADTTKDILEDFNHQFFDGKLKYNLEVVPSEKGGFVKIIRVVLTSGGLFIVGALSSGATSNIIDFLESDIGKSFIKNLTGEEPEHWSGQMGKKLGSLFIEKNDADYESDPEDPLSIVDEPIKEFTVNFITVLPAYFLSRDVGKLANSNITPDNFPKAFKARNKFYNSCIENEEVRGIAFDRSHDSWIERERFEGLRVDPPEETPEPQEFQFETTYIAVHSPDWEFTKARKWQCRDEKKQYIRFIIEDAIFSKYARDKNKNIKPTIKDTMQVQWIYQGEKASQKNVSVLKVISYNGAPISERLSEEEIQKICDDKNIFFKEQEDDKTENNIFNLFPDQLNNEKSELDDDSED